MHALQAHPVAAVDNVGRTHHAAAPQQHRTARAPQWTLPTLLLFAGDDKLVNPAGSRAFSRVAPAHVVTTHCFETLYHEIFNEAEPARQQVLAHLKSWLDARF